MPTILLNTITGAVSEYDTAFHSITPTHAGDAAGLFAFGGDSDAGAPIVAEVQTPKTIQASTLKKSLEAAYLSMRGTGSAEVRVIGQLQQWAYPFAVQADGVSRCKLGRGIRENYIGFGFGNPDGEYFHIDRIEIVMAGSKSRRSA